MKLIGEKNLNDEFGKVYNRMNLKFSVLLSLYIKENPFFLEQALKSIFEQTRLPTEIILEVDGQITEELQKVVDRFKNKYHQIFKIAYLESNVGLGIALNEGLKHCSYEFVARMDTDDISKPTRFEKQIELFEKNKHLDVVGSWIDEFDGDISNITSTRIVPEMQQEIFFYAKKRSPVNHPVVMFKKEAVMKAGGYKHFLLFEDYYLWVRMLMNGCQFYNIQESLLYFRVSSRTFKRRGGWKYAINELKFQTEIKKMGFINNHEFLKNISVRFLFRVIPNLLRAFLYTKLLRKQ
jgi:glycosyltransferase involved in cell wall biosynthesis